MTAYCLPWTESQLLTVIDVLGAGLLLSPTSAHLALCPPVFYFPRYHLTVFHLCIFAHAVLQPTPTTLFLAFFVFGNWPDKFCLLVTNI